MYIDQMKILPKTFKISKLTAGFTLVELLVVIGVLGILAAGLLATVDPLEQFRKASDSNKQQTALELVNAVQRYYANHGAFPWDTTTNGGEANCTGNVGNSGIGVSAGVQAAQASANTGFYYCMQALVDEGELKSTFTSQNSILRYLWIKDDSPTATEKTMRICYGPESKSQQKGPLAKWDSNNTSNLGSNCSTSGDCWICAQ